MRAKTICSGIEGKCSLADEEARFRVIFENILIGILMMAPRQAGKRCAIGNGKVDRYDARST